ncbi:MAG: glycosyltransferase [Candidatus Eremiobacteraeota bacterium]|nr:glycosyltransferase [Candidatus Eremiobacteraeota bacterium]
MPKASVVIATHNRAAELDDCLGALARQAVPEQFEVVVVDNGSQDATQDVIARHAGERVRSVFVADPNRAKARNAGIAASTGRILIFCDDDTVAPENFVAEHLRAHEGEQHAAVVSGPIVNVADKQGLIAPAARHYSRAFFCTCNVSVPKAELDAIGGFDERYDLYGWEDTDLGIRLRARGLIRLFAWPAYIYHIKPPRRMTLERRRALAVEKGTMAARFVRKAPSWPVRLATGAYGANFARAAIVNAKPLRALYERLARKAGSGSLAGAFACEALVDAAYVDALKAALQRAEC